MKLTDANHPSMYFTKDDVNRLKAKRYADPTAAFAWQRVLKRAQKALSEPLPEWSYRWEYDSGSVGQLNLGAIARKSAVTVSSLALAYLLTEEERFARRAVDITMALCDFDFWVSPIFFTENFRIPWRGTIETRHLCQATAWCYDWLFDYMTPGERECVSFNLAYKGVMPLIQDWADPYTRLPLSTHIKPWGNWWASCVAIAGMGALVLWDEKAVAKRWVKLARDAFEWFYKFEGGTVPKMDPELALEPEGTYHPPNFDSEGGYCEGLMYVDAVLADSFFFTEPYQRKLGEEILPLDLMHKISQFILYNSIRLQDRMRVVNFDDTRSNWATSPVVTAFLANKLRDKGLQWYLHWTKENFNEPSPVPFHEYPAFTFIWYDPDLEPEEPSGAAPVKVFPGIGWASMRSGWGSDDVVLGLKCGATAGHAHPDAGHFVLYYKNKCLVMDAGTCGYEMPEQNQYYQTSRAHNVVLVNGRGQTKRLPGEIRFHEGVQECAMICADATAPYEGLVDLFVRRILFLDQRYYVVLDELQSNEPSTFEWLLHFDEGLKRTDKGFLISQDEARLLVEFVEPSVFDYRLEKGYRPMHEDFEQVQTAEEKHALLEAIDYLSIRPKISAKRQLFITVLYPYGAEDPLPVIRRVQGKNGLGVEIDRDDKVDVVGLRTGVGPLSISFNWGDVETDAKAFGIITRKVSRPTGRSDSAEAVCFVKESGMHLKFNGKDIADKKS